MKIQVVSYDEGGSWTRSHPCNLSFITSGYIIFIDCDRILVLNFRVVCIWSASYVVVHLPRLYHAVDWDRKPLHVLPHSYLISSLHCRHPKVLSSAPPRVLLCHVTMVTTWSRRSSSSAATDHNPSRFVRRQSTASPSSVVTPAEFPSRPFSSRRSRSGTTPSASPHPPISHFISQACSTRYIDLVFRESLIVVGAANATGLVLPQIITTLDAHAGVPALSTYVIGSSDTIKVNNQVTLHRSDAHCTFGCFSIEQ
ncbi:unnamed protein product [Prunus brigantina]